MTSPAGPQDGLLSGPEAFRLITESMREGLVIVDNSANVLTFNNSAMKLLGNDIGSISDTVRRALTGSHEEQTLHIGDSVYSVMANPAMKDGEITGAVIIILDITEKEQRDALRREFTSNVSHELKTPLTSIYGISEMMVSGIVKPEDVRGFADNIHYESGRLISLIDDIIRLSRLDENTMPPEKTPVDLLEMARDIAERVRPAARLRGISVTVSGDSAPICGAAAILDEMIFNLADNAVKYNRDGGNVLIRVTGGAHPAVCVEDTGIGIAKQHQTRVFERFYRVDKSHSRRIGGTGLGLSIVKHGAAFHNASVSLESDEGRGTRVTISF